jgi:hypothetical protein
MNIKSLRLGRRLIFLVAVLLLAMWAALASSVLSPAYAQASTASISPTRGAAGSSVTGTGNNWRAGERMQVSWADTGVVLGNTIIDSGSNFSVNFQIPSGVPDGAHTVYFTDLDSRYFLPVVFTVGTSSQPGTSSGCPSPQLYMTPTSGLAGSRFLMKGARWVPGDVVHVTLPYGSKGLFYPEAVTPQVGSGAASGSWQTGVTVGSNTPPGSYTFTFTESAPQCSSKELKMTGTFQVR